MICSWLLVSTEDKLTWSKITVYIMIFNIKEKTWVDFCSLRDKVGFSILLHDASKDFNKQHSHRVNILRRCCQMLLSVCFYTLKVQTIKTK